MRTPPTTSLNFTKAALAALSAPPSGKRSYFRDTKTRGLTFAITDKGTRSFVFYRKIKGRPQRINIGRFDELSIEQARNKAAELNALVATGWDPSIERDHRRQEPTLRELFDEFMKRHATANIRWSAKYGRQFERYFRTTQHGGLKLSDRKVKDVTRADIARVFGNITAKGQPVTANRVLAMISSVFGWSVRAGLIEANPAHGIRKNSEHERARDRFLQPSEMPYFFQAVAAHDSDVMRDYVLLSLLTGQRQANVLAMEWIEIDFTVSLWRIPKEKTKTAREYLVPLTPDAVAILRGRQQGPRQGQYVFPGEGKTGHFAEPKNGWKRLLIRAEAYALIDAVGAVAGWNAQRIEEERQAIEFGMACGIERLRQQASELEINITGLRFGNLWMHDLRRTLASWQATTGANLVAISKTLNHSNVATTGIYARLQTDPVRQAMQVATNAMLTAAGLRTSRAQVMPMRSHPTENQTAS